MTLHRHYQWATRALVVGLILSTTVSLAALWWWASQWGLLAASLSAPFDLFDVQSFPIWGFLCCATVVAGGLRLIYAAQLASLTDDPDKLPLATVNYLRASSPPSCLSHGARLRNGER